MAPRKRLFESLDALVPSQRSGALWEGVSPGHILKPQPLCRRLAGPSRTSGRSWLLFLGEIARIPTQLVHACSHSRRSADASHAPSYTRFLSSTRRHRPNSPASTFQCSRLHWCMSSVFASTLRLHWSPDSLEDRHERKNRRLATNVDEAQSGRIWHLTLRAAG